MNIEVFEHAEKLNNQIKATEESIRKMNLIMGDLTKLEDNTPMELIIQYQKHGQIVTTHHTVRKESVHGVLHKEREQQKKDLREMREQFEAV